MRTRTMTTRTTTMRTEHMPAAFSSCRQSLKLRRTGSLHKSAVWVLLKSFVMRCRQALFT